jgi:hypothetical protein
MMNDEMDQFESRLRQQPVRPVPAEWRAEILSVASVASPTRPASRVPAQSLRACIRIRLAALLWPHPKAWAGLAAVWICIFVLNVATRESTAVVAEKISPPSPEVIVELKMQHRMFAELVGVYDAPDVERRKIFSPKPRSERVEMLVG